MASGLMMVKLGLAAAFFLCVAIGRPGAEAAVTCGQVTSSLIPCLNYLQVGGAVPAACCNGVRSLNSAAKTTPDRRVVCTCLFRIINGSSYTKKNIANAAALPGKCGVNLPYVISPKIDCRNIKM